MLAWPGVGLPPTLAEVFMFRKLYSTGIMLFGISIVIATGISSDRLAFMFGAPAGFIFFGLGYIYWPKPVVEVTS